MKLIDGIKQIGKPFEIPDSTRNDLPQLLKDLGYKEGAEIGVYRADFTKKFCEAGLKMFAIDPWMGYVGAGRSEKVQEMQDYNYECAQKNVAQYPDCKLIRKSSMDALADFKKESLDFVYIDGDHRFPFIAEDIYFWYDKVKKGGVICGDDYFCTSPEANNVQCHVEPVVDAFVATKRIPNFYIIGRNDKKPSWIIFKPTE